MKPHELIQRRRRQRGAKAAPPQMRERNGAGAAPAAPGIPTTDPRNQLPARRPVFAGETRAQELERQRLTAVVIRPGGPGAPLQPAPAAAGGAQPAPPPPPSTQNVITLCACPSHAEGDCENVATLRAVWPAPDAAAWPSLVDVCEECAAALKADPVGALVTGLAFLPLYPPMHDAPEDPPDDAYAPAARVHEHFGPCGLEHACDRCGAAAGEACDPKHGGHHAEGAADRARAYRVGGTP